MTKKLEETAVRSRLREWIRTHAKSKLDGELRDDTPILERGILSSLDVVEFVLFIENLRGEEVDTDVIEPEVFASIDSLYRTFFAAERDSSAA